MGEYYYIVYSHAPSAFIPLMELHHTTKVFDNGVVTSVLDIDHINICVI